MAAKQKEKPEPQLDSDGIVIVEYQQTVLVIAIRNPKNRQCMERGQFTLKKAPATFGRHQKKQQARTKPPAYSLCCLSSTSRASSSPSSRS